jgi:hypothetical protein
MSGLEKVACDDGIIRPARGYGHSANPKGSGNVAPPTKSALIRRVNARYHLLVKGHSVAVSHGNQCFCVLML